MRRPILLIVSLVFQLTAVQAAQVWFDVIEDRCFLPVNPLYQRIYQTASVPPDPTTLAALSQTMSAVSPASLGLSLVGRDSGGPAGTPGIDSLFELNVIAHPQSFPTTMVIEIDYTPRDASGGPLGAISSAVVTVQPTFFDIDFASSGKDAELNWRVRGLTTPFEPFAFQQISLIPIGDALRLRMELTRSAGTPNTQLPLVRMSITATADVPEAGLALVVLLFCIMFATPGVGLGRRCYTSRHERLHRRRRTEQSSMAKAS